MESLHTTHAHVNHTQHVNESFLHRIERKAEFNRYGIISMLFMVIGIVGGITIAISAYEHVWQIGAIATMTMLSLSLMLAVAPMKYIIRVTAVALALDLMLLLLNAIL